MISHQVEKGSFGQLYLANINMSYNSIGRKVFILLNRAELIPRSKELLELSLRLFLWLIVIKVTQRRIEISPSDTAHELFLEPEIVILQELNIASQFCILILGEPVFFCQFGDLLP